jgi:hypothetical protein
MRRYLKVPRPSRVFPNGSKSGEFPPVHYSAIYGAFHKVVKVAEEAVVQLALAAGTTGGDDLRPPAAKSQNAIKTKKVIGRLHGASQYSTSAETGQGC